MKYLLLVIAFTAPRAFAGVDVGGMLNWSNRFIANYPASGNPSRGVLNGHTTDNQACILQILKYDDGSEYISLGTQGGSSTGGGTGLTYVGTFINSNAPSGLHTIKALDVTNGNVSLDVVQDEADAPSAVENWLSITTDPQAHVSSAGGNSTYWPSSVCFFDQGK